MTGCRFVVVLLLQVLHALLITSGRMQDARQYLTHQLPSQVHCWTPAEDRILGGSDKQQTKQLISKLGKSAVATRIAFLTSQETA
jgi:hypothetical protein